MKYRTTVKGNLDIYVKRTKFYTLSYNYT